MCLTRPALRRLLSVWGALDCGTRVEVLAILLRRSIADAQQIIA
jgi:hypothetical protein